MNWRDRLNQFMIGRYGTDAFSKALLALALVLYVVNLLVREELLSTIALLLIIYCYYRMFSKNVYKRANENQQFLYKTQKLRSTLNSYKQQFKNSKTHHIYKCPNCKQKIRVPRGKGRISIHCPKCHADFIKNS